LQWLVKLKAIVTMSSNEEAKVIQTHGTQGAKPTIAVDLDEVLGQFLQQLALFHNEEYGTSLTIKDFHSYHFADVWECTDEEASARVRKYFASKYFEDIPPVPKAFDVLSKHKDSFRFVVVTARQHFLEETTRQWIAKHYPELFDDILFGNHYGTEGKKVPKSELCKTINAIALLDDSLHHALDCSPIMTTILLVDLDGQYTWNQNPNPRTNKCVEVPSNVQRLFSWEQIDEALEKLKPVSSALRD